MVHPDHQRGVGGCTGLSGCVIVEGGLGLDVKG
jgi:hypothetical protein